MLTSCFVTVNKDSTVMKDMKHLYLSINKTSGNSGRERIVCNGRLKQVQQCRMYEKKHSFPPPSGKNALQDTRWHSPCQPGNRFPRRILVLLWLRRCSQHRILSSGTEQSMEWHCHQSWHKHRRQSLLHLSTRNLHSSGCQNRD